MEDPLKLFRQHSDACIYDGPYAIVLRCANVEFTIHRYGSLPMDRVIIFNEGPCGATHVKVLIKNRVLFFDNAPYRHHDALWVINDTPPGPQKQRHITLYVNGGVQISDLRRPCITIRDRSGRL